MKKSIERQDNAEAISEAEKDTDDHKIRYLCMKYNRHQQGGHLACQDPDLYCKYRSSCLIHYKEKQRRRREQSAVEGSGV